MLKSKVSLSSDKFNSKLTGMYRKMNNIVDKIHLSKSDNDIKDGISKLMILNKEVIQFKDTIPEIYDFNINDAIQLSQQINNNITNLKKLYLQNKEDY